MRQSDIHRIHILGGPGSGKSYLAARLGEAMQVPVCDLDELFWHNESGTYGVRAEPAERDRSLREFTAQKRWIVEGVYHQWAGESFERADAIVLLTPGARIRDGRIVKRFLRRKFGLAHAPKRETFKGLIELLRWNHAYDTDNLARAMDSLAPHAHKLHRFDSADEALRCLLSPE
jgi:adenylate kinase family enzyme